MDLDLTNLLGQLAITAISLGIAALGYSAWFASGIANAAIKTKKWSWKRTFTDLGKVMLAVYVVFAVVVGFNLIKMVAAVIGLDISVFTDVLSTSVVAGTALIGAGMFFTKAISNVWALWKFKQIDKNLVSMDSDVNYNRVGEQVIEFFDTITNKTAKEDFEESLKTKEGEVIDVLDYEEVEAGKGGIVNTYPNTPQPYRTASQDSLVDPSTCYNRECVSYCASKIYELTGKWPTRTGGMSAKYWIRRLAENGYTKVVDRPVNGGKYVGVSDKGEYGHVNWFEGGSTISEYNYLVRGGFSVRNIDLSAYKWVEIKAPAIPAPAPATPDKKPTKKDPAIYYTYQQGDTFGQVIVDLGLKTSHGLWGADGDVIYYTNQLRAQGITGNIPVGKQIKLTPRV